MPIKLTQDKVYQLHKWIEEQEAAFIGTDTYQSLSSAASKQLRFTVTAANMSGAMAAMGRKLPRMIPPPPEISTSALQLQIQTVAASLVALMEENTHTVPKDLAVIAHPQVSLI